MPTNWNITAQSIPILDGWGWADYWQAQDWINWHKMLVDAYGIEKANYTMLYYYHEATFLAASYDWRTFNTEFIDYAKANDFYNGLFQGIGMIVKPFSIVIDTAGNIVNIIDNTGTAAVNTSKLLKYLLPILLIVIAIGLVIGVNKKFKILNG